MVRFALFGAGRIGQVHAASIDAHPDAELLWVCDPMTAPAVALAEKYGATATSDVDQAYIGSRLRAPRPAR